MIPAVEATLEFEIDFQSGNGSSTMLLPARKIEPTDFAAFRLQQYQIEALSFMSSKKPFNGARVLEIGGYGLPATLKFEVLGARSWLSLDLVSHGSGGYERYEPLNSADELGEVSLEQADPTIFAKKSGLLKGDIAKLPNWFANRFDLIVSIAAFEHILSLPLALEKIFIALAPNGNLLSYHGPIWSAFCGHHFWIDEGFNFNKLGPIGHWDHLLLPQPELYRKLRNANISALIAARAVDQIYCSTTVNRLFFEDYHAYMRSSPFRGYAIRPYGARAIPADKMDQLKGKYPENDRFDAYGMILNAWKDSAAS